jgi:succinoglycan biosynthesis protein ExoV
LELFYFKTPGGNFGDDLNLWLWDEILPGWREARPGTLLVGVGTLINGKLPRGVPKLILGSGFGYGDPPDAALKAECEFAAVRGPLSEQALGLPPGTGIVDPAVLVADMPAFRNIPRSGRPVFVPHHASIGRVDWKALCDRAGLDYLSPEGER